MPWRLAVSAGVLALGLAGAWTAVAIAQPSGPAPLGLEAGPRWSELSPVQRSLLAPIEREWPRMDDRSKLRWLGVASRLQKVGPAERERIQARMTEWASLSPQERGQRRLRYQEARQAAPKSRQDRWAAYQALPPEEREKLAARAGRPGHAASGAGAPDHARRRMAAEVTRRSVSPAVVQAQPGATTSLITRRDPPPLHLQPGEPRIMASPERIDRITLLPRRSPPIPPARPASE